MIAGMNVQQLAERLMAERASKSDFIAPTAKIVLAPGGAFGRFNIDELNVSALSNKLALQQAATWAGIPWNYTEKMTASAQELLATNFNHWLQRSAGEKRLIRTFSGSQARAFLSDKYRPLDYADLAEASIPVLERANVKIKSSQITEQRLYIQAVSERLTGTLQRGDIVQAMVVLSNSEVGCGSVLVETGFYTLSCTNGAIASHTMRRAHVGKRHSSGGDDSAAFEFLSDDTRKLEDAALWSKVKDMLNHALSDEGWLKLVEGLNAAQAVQLGEAPTKIVEQAAKQIQLSVGETEGVLSHLAKGGDFSLWGLSSAITRTAQDSADYDRAIELERIGGQIALSDGAQFKISQN